MNKGSIQEKDITIINVYAPNIGAPQYIRQMLTTMKGEINSNTVIVGDINTALTTMERSSRWQINKETLALNDTSDQVDLIDIYRAFHPESSRIHFQVHMARSLGEITCWVTKQALVNLRKLKSYQASFPTTVL